MQLIYLLIPLFSVWFANYSTIPQVISEWLFAFGIKTRRRVGIEDIDVPIRLKPLDCELCLSFWIGLFYSFNHFSFIESFLIGGSVSMVTLILSKLTSNLWKQ